MDITARVAKIIINLPNFNLFDNGRYMASQLNITEAEAIDALLTQLCKRG